MPVLSAIDNAHKKAHKIGLILSVAHIVLFLVTLAYIKSSNDPQASLIWVYFTFIDFPTIPLYFIPNLGSIVHIPYLAHGLLGALWWYSLPRLFMKKDYGGVWKNKRESKPEKLHTIYTVLGTILVLSGLGLNKSFGSSYLGMLLFAFGMFFVMKGTGIFFKIIPPKPWEKGPD
ncbi:hypothetical protein F3F96_04280 [Mariprofundus sp. NF]|uniref:hypothetical protein n=1 Tax=Mariprofundus sp. NF TaxID=2608716 RepID=UPI0015A44407|nr:hypothetical protein [Mariprofundus sp. NF]NWF38344.1 hypothetical protein [Mariprofundus sp. NF]